MDLPELGFIKFGFKLNSLNKVIFLSNMLLHTVRGKYNHLPNRSLNCMSKLHQIKVKSVLIKQVTWEWQEWSGALCCHGPSNWRCCLDSAYYCVCCYQTTYSHLFTNKLFHQNPTHSYFHKSYISRSK